MPKPTRNPRPASKKTEPKKLGREAIDPEGASWIDDLPILPPLGQGYSVALVMQREQPIRSAHASKRQGRMRTRSKSRSQSRQSRKK